VKPHAGKEIHVILYGLAGDDAEPGLDLVDPRGADRLSVTNAELEGVSSSSAGWLHVYVAW
jgi:hypothetical protein